MACRSRDRHTRRAFCRLDPPFPFLLRATDAYLHAQSLRHTGFGQRGFVRFAGPVGVGNLDSPQRRKDKSAEHLNNQRDAATPFPVCMQNRAGKRILAGISLSTAHLWGKLGL